MFNEILEQNDSAAISDFRFYIDLELSY